MRFQFLKNYGVYITIALLVPVALFLNLGKQALLADEPTRALVMMEMKLNHNLLVPTINGQYYYNKPPLFNWILYATTELVNSEHEFWLRFPSAVGFLLLSLLSYFIVKQEFDRLLAIWIGLAVLTSARILFYDSFLGLIDSLFASCILLLFGITRKYSKEKQWGWYFIFSWLVTLVAFFLKGLPALVFQGICMMYVHLRFYSLKRIFHPLQFVGFLVFLVPVIAYYCLYSLKADLYPLLEALVKESSKRTVMENSAMDSLRHFFIFPFELLLNFFPWTIFLLLIPLKTWKMFYMDSRVRFWIELIALNLIVYWLSPETRPRYLLMFVPFILLPGMFYIYEKYSGKWKTDAVLASVIVLLVLRVGFNGVVLPHRAVHDGPDRYKREAEIAAELSANKPLVIHRYTVMTHEQSFYIERKRRQILGIRHGAVIPDTLFLTYYPDSSGLRTLDSIPSAFENSTVYLCQKEN